MLHILSQNHRWATILKNVSIKAILIHNFWEKNRIKRYNFVRQNFFHQWSDRKNRKKISQPMKRYNIPRYKSFTSEATPNRSPFSKMYRLQRFWKLYGLKRQNFPARFWESHPHILYVCTPLDKKLTFPFFKTLSFSFNSTLSFSFCWTNIENTPYTLNYSII